MKKKIQVISLTGKEELDVVELAMLVRRYSHEYRNYRFRIVASDKVKAKLKTLGILELIEK